MQKNQPTEKTSHVKVEDLTPPDAGLNMLEVIKLVVNSTHGVHASYICQNEEEEVILYFAMPAPTTCCRAISSKTIDQYEIHNNANFHPLHHYVKSTVLYKTAESTASSLGWIPETAKIFYQDANAPMLQLQFASDTAGENKKFSIVFIPVILVNTNPAASVELFRKCVEEYTNLTKMVEVTSYQLHKAAKFTNEAARGFTDFVYPNQGALHMPSPMPPFRPYPVYTQNGFANPMPFPTGGDSGVCGDFAPVTFGTNPNKNTASES